MVIQSTLEQGGERGADLHNLKSAYNLIPQKLTYLLSGSLIDNSQLIHLL